MKPSIALVSATLLAAPSLLVTADTRQSERLNKINHAKFGMFIHWGPYSLVSVETFRPYGGFTIGSSQHLMTDIPAENIAEMYDAAWVFAWLDGRPSKGG